MARLNNDDVEDLGNGNERAFINLLSLHPQHITDVEGEAVSREFPHDCAKTALDMALRDMDD